MIIVEKIWSGGASDSGGPDLSALMTTEDNTMDSHLVNYEIAGLIAYHIELSRTGLLPDKDSAGILRSLLSIMKENIELTNDFEDVHSLVEQKIMEKSESGKNLRIFLSRNDQSHLDIRSFYLDSLLEIAGLLAGISSRVKHDLCSFGGIMPGYTHYRQAMPVSISTYFDHVSATFLDLSRDSLALFTKLSEHCPLGYGSGYGSPIPVDMNAVAGKMGYGNSYVNPMHGASYRGVDDSEMAFLETRIMAAISRISQDLIIFSSEESGFVVLPPGFATGSSLMPNKKNPDFLEMLQGYASEALGKLITSLTATMNKTSGYHRDFQLSKDKTMSFTIRIRQILEALKLFFSGMEINKEAARDSIANSSYATMESFALFESGMKWKDAYIQVGEYVRDGKKLNEYAPETYISVAESTISAMEERIVKLKSERAALLRKLEKEANLTIKNLENE